MLNNVKRSLGYRDIIYNIDSGKFYTYVLGDQFKPLDINAGVGSGGTDDRPSEPNTGELFWDIDLEQLVVWNGTEWEPVGSGGKVTVPSGPLWRSPQ